MTGTARPRGDSRAISDVIVDCAVYEDGRRQPGSRDLGEAWEDARAAGGFVWVGLHQPTEEQVNAIAARLDLPTLAVEDAVRAHQRPKLERYDDITFVIVKPVRYLDRTEVVDVGELAVFLGPHFVVTVRHGESAVTGQVRSEFDEEPGLLRHGPAAVVHRLVDLVVDQYAHVIDEIRIDIDEIEEQVFGGAEGDHSQRIYKLKREVLDFRRAVAPLVPVTQRLVEGAVPGTEGELLPFFRDVHDHVLRAADEIESFDRLLTDVLSAHLAQVTVRQNATATQQNEDMRKISAWAAIALVPTAIAGIYGMNFEHMPELETRYGYPVVLLVITAACVFLHWLFRRNDWL